MCSGPRRAPLSTLTSSTSDWEERSAGSAASWWRSSWNLWAAPSFPTSERWPGRSRTGSICSGRCRRISRPSTRSWSGLLPTPWALSSTNRPRSGTTHRVWVAATGWDEALQEIRNSRLMIADGHHRYTVALAHRDEMRARHGAGPWDAMMTMVVDARAENPPVLPIHRVVMGGALPEAPRGDPVRDLAEVLATVSDDDLTLGVVAIEDGRLIHRIASLPGVPPVVCALHEQILDRAPNIALRFEPDAARAEQAVGSGVASAAYVLPPTQVDRVWNLVSEGKLLPQKSTYFWPKPRTGLVIRPFWP
ncbi:MAG: DUF1015 domain-containing protein [Actinobacteria bacterium]|nr:MAG: DUF1015 domain-containing protein [Actinomycetota bacterium]